MFQISYVIFLVFFCLACFFEFIVFNEEVLLTLCFLFFIFFVFNTTGNSIFNSFKDRGSKIEFDLFLGFISLRKNHYLNFFTKTKVGSLVLNFNIIEDLCTIFFFEHSVFHKFSILKTFSDYAKNSLLTLYRSQQAITLAGHKKSVSILLYPITNNRLSQRTLINFSEGFANSINTQNYNNLLKKNLK